MLRLHWAAGSAWRAAGGHCSGCDRVVAPVRPPFSLSPARLALWVGEVEHLSRDKGITRPSATPWGCWWLAAGVALLLCGLSWPAPPAGFGILTEYTGHDTTVGGSNSSNTGTPTLHGRTGAAGWTAFPTFPQNSRWSRGHRLGNP